MMLLEIPLPNLIFYAAIALMIVWALLHASEARQFERELVRATDLLERRVGTLLSLAGRNDQGTLSATALRSQIRDLIEAHPSAEALECVLAEPDVARDELAVQSWIAGAVHRRLGRLRSAVELPPLQLPPLHPERVHVLVCAHKARTRRMPAGPKASWCPHAADEVGNEEVYDDAGNPCTCAGRVRRLRGRKSD